MKVFLAVPDTISEEERLKLLYKLESEGHKVLCHVFVGDWWSEAKMRERGIVNRDLNIFAEALRDISTCDAIYFADGWENSSDCKLQHDCAVNSNMQILYEHTKEGSVE